MFATLEQKFGQINWLHQPNSHGAINTYTVGSGTAVKVSMCDTLSMVGTTL